MSARGGPAPLDAAEPERVGEAVAKLGLAHVVITSVDRDDLADGGAGHFAAVIRAIRAATPGTTIEVLTPDFLRKDGRARDGRRGPARRLQPQPRDRAVASICASGRARAISIRCGFCSASRSSTRRCSPSPASWSGLGETRDEVLQVMDDLRAAEVDFLTIGQYLQPTRKHAEVKSFVPPEEFEAYGRIAYAKGFLWSLRAR